MKVQSYLRRYGSTNMDIQFILESTTRLGKTRFVDSTIKRSKQSVGGDSWHYWNTDLVAKDVNQINFDSMQRIGTWK